MAKQKTFYVVSGLLEDSNPLGKLKQHPTEREAIESAKGILESRAANGSKVMDFYVLKVVAQVGYTRSPVKVSRLT